jgi:ectoine hydroxylase-related dioxygenase (phytanoyl-CoA dioxygenase family)
VLFKEKINFKFSGANGFTPHQDYPAFLSFGQTYHITMMLAIDDCTIENGCLQIANNIDYMRKVLPQAKDKTIHKDIV